MEVFLGKITQHAMNYAIRAGIGITASYTIRQTSRLLKTVDDNADYQELQNLQELLDTKIKIVSPAIDMIDIISARGNTTLESAVTLTKSLRWDIQELGIRLAKAAAAEESSRRKSARATSKATHHAEIRLIVQDIKKLLAKIDHAVPLINLALASSGAKLSTTMPATVSPSRMLQASYMVNTGDFQYSMNPAVSAQVGPTFTLSLYMLFAGHSNRVRDGADGMRETTWKEAIHKARVKLMRIPLRTSHVQSAAQILQSIEKDDDVMTGEARHNEYAYHIEIIEDLNDGRVHSFEDDEAQPGPYGDIQLAGIRDFLPIHQISKIFYADTGKILNIGNEGEANSPVLLLKRDINAAPPRRMMQESERDTDLYEDEEESEEDKKAEGSASEESDNDSDDVDAQIRRESSVAVEPAIQPHVDDTEWRLPADLDTEWLAFEVYTEPEDSDSETELEQDINDDSAYVSHRPSSSDEEPNAEKLSDGLANLHLSQKSPSPSPAQQMSSPPPFNNHFSPAPSPSPFGPTRSSLSLLEMLIRLTALQQFQQASHLTIPDELLTFFLEESSTTGAGGEGEQRRRTRADARRRVGFDPYDESPVKRHGEDYQYQGQNWDQGQGQGWDSQERSRGNTPYEEYDYGDGGLPRNNPNWSRGQSMPTQRTPEPWLLSRREGSSRRGTPEIPPSSPVSPYRPQQRKGPRPLDRVQSERGVAKSGSPLGRGMSVETDSTLGTSPGSPTLVDRGGKI